MGRKKREYVEYHKQSLGEQIEDPETYGVRTKPRAPKRHRGTGESDEEEGAVPGELSHRILEVAREQQEEVEAEDDEDVGAVGGDAREALAAAMRGLAGAASDSDDEDAAGALGDDWSDPGDGAWEEEWEEEMNGQDEAALAAFMAPGARDARHKTLSDVILEKIREKQAAAGLSEVPR
jgi:essential nuclear protein 1